MILAELKAKAKREQTTVSEIVRVAVVEHLGRKSTANWDNDTIWHIVGFADSSTGDLSENHDDYLYGKNE
jgi:hypothetical protein